VEKRFVTIGCTVGSFSSRDAQLAQDFQCGGIPLETVQGALLMGAVRKYVSWLNGGLPQPIGSLAYFSASVIEIHQRPLPAGYDEYLQRKVVQLARAWEGHRAQAARDGSNHNQDENRSIAACTQGELAGAALQASFSTGTACEKGNKQKCVRETK
jgi:hypothetical protein